MGDVASLREDRSPGPLLPPFAFRLAGLCAVVRTDDPEFRARFLQVFRDCIVATPAGPGSCELVVRAPSDAAHVSAEMPVADPPGVAARWAALFPELDLVPVGESAAGSASLGRRADPRRAVFSVGPDRILVEKSLPWQTALAHFFIDHLMRAQPEWGFFHAAAVVIGNAGVLIGGSKGAGKTTLALALAARGHGFLGDEIAAVHAETGQIAPFPRAVSIRRGPQARAVAEYLERMRPDVIRLPDGTDRVKVPVSGLFPESLAPATRLTHAFFLGARKPAPALERFRFAAADLPHLSPMHGTLGTGEPGRRVMQFLKLFARAECWRLQPGAGPERTAEAIENALEGKWDTACRRGPSSWVPSAG